MIADNFHKLGSVTKKITKPFLVPPKLGWKAAKYGARIAQKPIDTEAISRGVKNFILGNSEKVVTELKPDDFKKMMMAASKKIVLYQEEINKINVFPVADKDTGYNLAATLLGVEGVISLKNYADFRELTQDIKDAALINARGNAGMIYTGYLMEVLDRIKHLETVNAFHLALALRRGIKAARSSVAEPVEGTILDITKAVGEKAYQVVKEKKEKNIIKVLEEAQKVSETALKETKEKLEVLKQNDVVDAGALGFVKILEAWVESLKGLTPAFNVEAALPSFEPPIAKEELKYPYETIITLKNSKEINLAVLKEELSSLGDSLDSIETADRIKIHIHTDKPDIIQEKFKDLPGVEFLVEDIQKEIKKIIRRPLGLVVGQTASLPKEFLEKYQIEEVLFTTRFPGGEIVASKEELYPKMREALKTGKPLPTTSAPPFHDFLLAYKKALEKFERILVITISSKLSGAYSSARIARSTYQKPEKNNIFVFDCFLGEVAEGLTAIRAQELISQGRTMEEIVEELKEFCPQIELFGCLSDFRYIARGGRLRLPEILTKPLSFIPKMALQPLLALKNGKIKISGLRFGKNIAKILAKEVKDQRADKEIVAAIAHADNLEGAEELKKELELMPKVKVLFVSSVSPAIGTHLGPGALMVAFHSLS
ncbi:MAG: DegV family protein [bacterium]